MKTILEAERASKLAFEKVDGRDVFKPEKLANTWFLKFMHMLSRSVPNAREIFANVAFVIFNYDRCVEHFLYNALQRVYGIRENDAADILADCTIIHPYGLVGPYLPISGGVPFGTTSADYRQLSQQIKTYTEQIAAADLMEQIEADQAKGCVRHRISDVKLRYRCCFAPNSRFLSRRNGQPGTKTKVEI